MYLQKSGFGDPSYTESASPIFLPVILEVCYNLEEYK